MPKAYCYTIRWRGKANWLQGSEGNIDPVHKSFSHQILPHDPEMRARWGVFSVNARPNFVMRNACAVSALEGDLRPGGCTILWDVPIDGGHLWRYEFIFHRSGKLDKAALETQYTSENSPATRCAARPRIAICKIANR